MKMGAYRCLLHPFTAPLSYLGLFKDSLQPFRTILPKIQPLDLWQDNVSGLLTVQNFLPGLY